MFSPQDPRNTAPPHLHSTLFVILLLCPWLPSPLCHRETAGVLSASPCLALFSEPWELGGSKEGHHELRRGLRT